MSITSAKNVCKIWSENYMKCVRKGIIFSVKEQRKENRKNTIPLKCKQK